MISILLHLYYPESVSTVLPALTREFLSGTRLYINLVKDNPFDEEALKAYENVYILRSSNVGKDIGGKLALIDSMLCMNDSSDYWIFLHDKNSPHTSTGRIWRESLFSIAENRNKSVILDKMKDPSVGMVTHKNFILNEWIEKESRFNTVNNNILLSLLKKYDLQPSSYEFAAGTMFWAKTDQLKKFFLKHEPLSIRAGLERGNVLDHHAGTYAHSWERLLSWIACGENRKIVGIE